MKTFNTIRARAERLEEKQAALASGEYYLPDPETMAFQFRLVLFELTDGDPERVREQINIFHPKEIDQIMSLQPDEWEPQSWKRIETVQGYIRAARGEAAANDRI